MKQKKSKKKEILSFFLGGQMQLEEIGKKFDLYTSTRRPMNGCSRLFANRLGFKTKKIAQRSVKFLDQSYRRFKKNHGRTGQHHALVVALTMFNRSRWMRKKEEASIFQRWIIALF